MSHRLVKFYSDVKHAEAFIDDGEMLFSSLSVFRDWEDNGVREDRHEGVSVYRPRDGLAINNHTQGKTFVLSEHALVSTVSQAEIFVFCLSRSMSEEMRARFNAKACLEIRDVRRFCSIVEHGLERELAPRKPTYPGPPLRTRIGHRVVYYSESDDCNPRWAFPDVIATSKLEKYRWQDEFRLVFSITDALNFEKCSFQVSPDTEIRPANTDEHARRKFHVGNLHDLCHIHYF